MCEHVSVCLCVCALLCMCDGAGGYPEVTHSCIQYKHQLTSIKRKVLLEFPVAQWVKDPT